MSHIEINEMLGLMGDIRSEVPSDNTMPGWVVLLIEFLLYKGSNVLLDVELLKGLVGAINRVLLHLLGHVGVLHHRFTVSHFGRGKEGWGIFFDRKI